MPTLPALVLIPALLLGPPVSTAAIRPPPTQDSLRAKSLIVAGSSGFGFGLLMLAFMGVELRRGDAQRMAHNDVIHAATGHQRPLTPAERGQLAGIDSLGRVANQSAIGFAITGVLVTIVGAVLLGRAVRLHRRAQLAWSGTPRSLGLALRF